MNFRAPIKLDFIINKMSAGGAERVISILANHLSKDSDYEVRIITFQGKDAYYLSEKITRFRFHKTFLFKSVVFNGYFHLMRHYRNKSNRPDIISSHIDLLGYLTIPIAKFYRIPIIVSEHNNHQANNSFWQSFLWDRLYPSANAVTVLTAYDKDFFLQRNRCVKVMPNPCSFKPYLSNEIKRKKEIVAIGNLNRFHQKGFDNLIAMAANFLPQNPDWHLKIIGGGEWGLTLLKKLVSEHSLKQQITFTGLQDNVQNHLQEGAIFVLPSRFEGLPMVLLEAMSQGIACIAYDCVSGPADVIDHDLNGILIKDQDQNEMVKGILELIHNVDKRSALQNQAPYALTKFTVDEVGSLWKSLIGDILGFQSSSTKVILKDL